MLAPSPQLPAQMPAQPEPMSAGLVPPLPAPKLHDVTIVTRKEYSCARVVGVPPEEFGIARNARSLRECNYCFHEVTHKTEADLIDEGYDADQVKALPTYSMVNTIEGYQRDTVDESRTGTGTSGETNAAMRLIRVTEHYIRMNYDGEKVRLYRVTTGSEQGDILRRNGEDEIVEVDEMPFAAMTPVIVTHRFFGRSIADLVMDIQRIKTALVRGMLDNLYRHNNPRAEIAESLAGENTIDDYLVSTPGGMIRTHQPGCINWQTVPDITGAIYPALQYMDATREWRTGVSRQGQGVDANALQNQVATIANQMQDAAQAKCRLIARIFAETGIKDLFSLLHGIIRKNGSQADTVRLRNQWVNVDPRDWKERNDMTINVGLGTGNKAQQLAGHQMLMAAQKELLPAGVVSKNNIYKSAAQLTKLLGHKNPEEFFVAPGQQQGQPQDPDAAPIQPPPDKDVQKLQMEYQLKDKEANNRAAIEKTQAEADIATNNAKLQNEAAMQERKFQFDAAMAEREFQLKEREALLKAELDREKHQQSMVQGAQNHEHALRAGAEKHGQAMEAARTKQSQAVVEVKQDTAPIEKAMASQHEQVMGVLQQLAKPKRVRKNKDGSWQTEAVTE